MRLMPHDAEASYLPILRLVRWRLGSYLKPMVEKYDINDGEPWTEMDVQDLTAALKYGDTLEEAAMHLCRSGTVGEVRRKAEELELISPRITPP